MKKSRLIELLFSSSEDEVYIINPDTGLLVEIDDSLEHYEESFDGFDTVYPAAIGLKTKRQKEEEEWI